MEEVWAWKDAAYEETKDKSFEELKLIYEKAMADAANSINAKLVKLPDGNYRFE